MSVFIHSFESIAYGINDKKSTKGAKNVGANNTKRNNLSWKCCRHVNNMSMTGSNVRKFQKQLVYHGQGFFSHPSHVSEACHGH